MLAVAVVLVVAAFASAATNLIANGTFEGSGSGSLTGWGGSNSSLSLVAGDGSAHAARVTVASASQAYAYTTTKPVKTTVAGTAYQLTGAVRSDNPGQSVCLKLKEVPAGGSTTVGSAQTCVTHDDGVAGVPDRRLHDAQGGRLADRERRRGGARRGRDI